MLYVSIFPLNIYTILSNIIVIAAYIRVDKLYRIYYTVAYMEYTYTHIHYMLTLTAILYITSYIPYHSNNTVVCYSTIYSM